jgi:methylated-DNA-protein-cysteine methyltransferase-like protein
VLTTTVLPCLQVYHVTRQIPAQRVTSYGERHLQRVHAVQLTSGLSFFSGHIAKLIGMPRHARHVGQGSHLRCNCSRFLALIGARAALKFLSPNTQPPVPWHRVVSSSGAISSRGPGTDGARRQRDALIAEGVEVGTSNTGEMRVDLGTWGWFPIIGSVSVTGDGEGTDDQ